ncbi:hypothetical protein ACFYR1_44265 [Streptomyces canus]|uniref:hypothetical protein n=1 Tax=Streptomyces canus TaxID=58343 RepID=UPI003683F920
MHLRPEENQTAWFLPMQPRASHCRPVEKARLAWTASSHTRFKACRISRDARGEQLQQCGVGERAGVQRRKDAAGARSVKGELLDPAVRPNRAAARTTIFDFNEGWYNLHRLHKSHGYRRPAEYETHTLSLTTTTMVSVKAEQAQHDWLFPIRPMVDSIECESSSGEIIQCVEKGRNLPMLTRLVELTHSGFVCPVGGLGC